MRTNAAVPQHPKADRRHSLVGQSALTTLAAALGLLTGLAVDAVIGVTFGAGMQTDSFFVGARLPLAVATIVLIGANQALVPVMASWFVTHDRRSTGLLSAGVCAISVVVGVLLGLLAISLSGQLAAVQAPGLSPASSHLAAEVLRVMALTIPFTMLAEVLRAYLNAQRVFIGPALVSVVLNVTVIVVLVSARGGGVLVVAWGYVAGNLLRVAVLLLLSVSRGLALNPLPALRRREAWSAAALCARPFAGAGLGPLVRLIEQAVVSLLPSGSISLLNYGYRLVSGVGGAVFFRSVIVALVPRLTQAVTRGEEALSRALTALGIRMMLLASLPLACFMAVLAEPTVRLLFNRGRFDSSSAALLGLLLTLFSLSMPPDGITRAQQAPYFSRRNTRMPLRNNVVGMVVNLTLLPAALIPDDPRIALLLVVLAYVISRWVTVLHGQVNLNRDGYAGHIGVAPTLRLLSAPLAAASVVMVPLAILQHLYAGRSSLALAAGLLVTATWGAIAFGMPLVLQQRRLRSLLASPKGSDVRAPQEPLPRGVPA